MCIAVIYRTVLCLCLLQLAATARLFADDRTGQTSQFMVPVSKFNTQSKQLEYFEHWIPGAECRNNSLNRLSLLSENQNDYPIPSSGCGPTALLNIMVWYEKYGLIPPFYREANPQYYKQSLFREIDDRLNKHSRRPRNDINGTNTLSIAVIIDEMIREQSKGRIRVHMDYMKAPLKLDDFLDSMPNFRAGYLVVQPYEADGTKAGAQHAATFIRADRSGYITLATWGEIYRGLLKKRAGRQRFIPQDPEHRELEIIALFRFTPFKPATTASSR